MPPTTNGESRRPPPRPSMNTVAQALAQLRRDLGLAAADEDDDQDQAVTLPAPIRRPRARRGLGPAYQGLRIPPGPYRVRAVDE
ncbi:hypothetical protein ACH4VR_42065 [Streptomyces sp. NPDC020883]|uniref:hypothetical protein n=2 Tax=unclassified Streptomyces TaxID=2593676 RepID=UPI003792FEFF